MMTAANSIDRLVLNLACGHNLLCDPEEGNEFPSSDWCPGCGLYVSVVGYDLYEDDDIGYDSFAAEIVPEDRAV